MESQVCVLCGENTATTKDHIPPKGIYPKPRANDLNLHTVPACRSCNEAAAPEDEEFKVLLGIDTGEFRPDPAQIIESLAGTIGHNSRIANQVFSTQQRGYADRGHGILEPVRAITFKPERYIKVIQRIVRGLYWRETSQVLGLTSKIQVIPARNIKQNNMAFVQDLLNRLPSHKLNGDTFIYKFQIDSEGNSFWAMQFFDKHSVFALVYLPTVETNPASEP